MRIHGYKIFDPNRLPPDLASYYKTIFASTEHSIEGLKLVSKKPLPKITSFYVESINFNAFVYPFKDEIFLCISAAIPSLLNAYFNTLLQSRTYLAENEINFLEIIQSKKIMTSLPESRRLEETIYETWRDTRSDEERRNQSAWILTTIALNFILEHEISHVELGHAHSCNLIGFSFLSERMNYKLFNKAGKEIKKVWEYEADIRGSQTIAHLVMDPMMREDLYELFEFSIDRPQDLLGLASSAIFSVFHLLNIVNANDESHPHPLLRFAYVADRLSRYCCRKFGGMKIDEVRRTLFDAAYNTYHSWGDLGLELDLNLGDSNFWYDKFDLSDVLENSRKELCQLYIEKAYHYPFMVQN